jgi:hypothetical protein
VAVGVRGSHIDYPVDAEVDAIGYRAIGRDARVRAGSEIHFLRSVFSRRFGHHRQGDEPPSFVFLGCRPRDVPKKANGTHQMDVDKLQINGWCSVRGFDCCLMKIKRITHEFESFSSSCAEKLAGSSVVSKLAILVILIAAMDAVSLVSSSADANTAQGGAAVSEAQSAGKRPSITASPERVKTDGKLGSSSIRWTTGDGTIGFVYVSVNGGGRTLFTSGATGNQTASWINAGTYVFELYADAERHTLLASVSVYGMSTPEVSEFWRRAGRWLSIVAAFVVLYLAAYSCSAGTMRTGFPVEPTTSTRRLYVTRNLLFGAAVFAVLDGIIFHTGLYTRILAPDSFGGNIALITRAEKKRVSSGLKEVLVLGDSRIAEGFSDVAADKLGSPEGFKFLKLAEVGSTVEIWYYMLRDVDPTARRYSAIVIPYDYPYERERDQLYKVSMAGPLLHYGDCLNFASVFLPWSDRFKAFTACILRGLAFQNDIVDLLEDPIRRIRSIQQAPRILHFRAVYKGIDDDIVGTSYDPKTGQLTFPPRLTEAQKKSIRRSVAPPSQLEAQHFLKLQRDWIQRILNRYSNGPTTIVFVPSPRGPFGGFPEWQTRTNVSSGFSMNYRSLLPGVVTQRAVFPFSEDTFNFLEKPEYYADGYHLNEKGRQKFTQIMVTELIRELQGI